MQTPNDQKCFFLIQLNLLKNNVFDTHVLKTVLSHNIVLTKLDVHSDNIALKVDSMIWSILPLIEMWSNHFYNYK